MEIKQMQMIKAIVQYKSYTKAAEALNYTQSNITQHIKKLEATFNQKLFIYKDKSLQQTAFLDEIMPMIHHILRTHDAIYSLSDLHQEEGTIRVAAPESLTLSGLGDVVRYFIDHHPNINIDLYNNTCTDNQKLLLMDEVDLALVVNHTVDDRLFNVQNLREIPIVMVSHAHAPDNFETLLKTDGYNHFITNEKESTYRRMFEDTFDKSLKTTELWSIGAIKQMLLDDVGFSVLPYNTVVQEIKNGSLKIIDHDLDFKTFHAFLLTQKQSWTHPLVKQFINQTKNVFKEK